MMVYLSVKSVRHRVVVMVYLSVTVLVTGL